MSRWVVFVALSGCAVPGDPVPTSAVSSATVTLAAPAAQPKTWRPVTTPPFPGPAAPVLLTDGTVMVQDASTSNWWQLKPNDMGDYAAGTWTQLASMPGGYAPLYTATGVLTDGRVVVQGGEYNGGQQAWTTQGALYDPVANSWKSVPAPAGWQTIGDASGMVMADGRWMITDCCGSEKGQAYLDFDTMHYTPTGTGKLDIHDEESWVELYDGTILTVDCNNTADLTAAESYDPATGMWTPAGHTPVQLADIDTADNSHEIGPAVLRHDGTILALGATGHNATYDPATKTWAAAPDLPGTAPNQLDLADGPAAVLPNGNILVPASPGIFKTPTSYFEWDGSSFTPTASPPGASQQTTYQLNLLMLPSGEMLMTDTTTDVEIYTPAPGHPDNAVPVITQAPQLMTAAMQVDTSDPSSRTSQVATADGITPVSNLFLGRVYKLSLDRMNGITQGAYYGDDAQTFSNYPIIRLTYQDTGHVRYLRSHDHSNRAIGPDKHGTTLFDVPPDAERGLAILESVANGIPSTPILVNVK